VSFLRVNSKGKGNRGYRLRSRFPDESAATYSQKKGGGETVGGPGLYRKRDGTSFIGLRVNAIQRKEETSGASSTRSRDRGKGGNSLNTGGRNIILPKPRSQERQGARGKSFSAKATKGSCFSFSEEKEGGSRYRGAIVCKGGQCILRARCSTVLQSKVRIRRR